MEVLFSQFPQKVLHETCSHNRRTYIVRFSSDAKFHPLKKILRSVSVNEGRVLGDGSELHDLPLLGVEQLELEAALVGVAEVPCHVEGRAGLDGGLHLA